MAAWLVQAVRAAAVIAGRNTGTLARGAAGGGAFAAGSTLLPRLFGGDDDGMGGGAFPRRRRRRRRALTASDRADIAFIQATLGQAAGKAFAMLVVSRTTG